MKINLLILGLIICLTAGVTYYFQNKQVEHSAKLYQTAPEFTYTTLSGVSRQLTQHAGKVILVHFWATWCPPCIVEFPDLIKLAQSQKDDFIILAISVDEKPQDIEKFMAKQQKTLPDNFIIIQDGKRHIAEGLFDIKKYPANFLLSPTLEIRETLKGPEENWNSNKWHQKIQKLTK